MITRHKFISLFLAGFLIGCIENNQIDQPKNRDEYDNEYCFDCNSKYWIRNFEKTHLNGTSKTFKLTATELIERQSKGQVIQFNDYREIYIKELFIEQPSDGQIIELNLKDIAPSISESRNTSTSKLDTHQNPKGPAILGNSLNRIIIEDFKLKLNPANNPSILLSSSHGKMLMDTKDIRFEGGVTLSAANCKITSDSAIWSYANRGLFFQDIFNINNNRYLGPVLYQITDSGECRKVNNITHVEYSDKLEVIEQMFLTSMPESVRFVFGLMGSLNNQVNFGLIPAN